MAARITKVTENSVKIEIEISFEDSFLKTEEKIQKVLNEAGCLASEITLKRHDTDGSAIEVNKKSMSCKGVVAKKYQTPFGEIEIARNVYQNNKGGKTYCPLDVDARIIKSTTPRFAKMIASKYANNNAQAVRVDLLDNHNRLISKTFIQDVSNSVGDIVIEKQAKWNYRLPPKDEEVKTIGCGIDGTCLLMCDDGYRETMVGTISFYDEGCERINTIYLAAAPEYGKKDFFSRYQTELDKVKQVYPNSTYVGIADGAKDNWTFLEKQTDVQILDYYHATEYVANVSHAVFRSEENRKDWLTDSCHILKHEVGGASLLLKEFKTYQREKKLGKSKALSLQKAITYFENNLSKMDYNNFYQNYYPIGSGVTEAACKVIVKQRLGNSGMKWKHQGAQNVLALRAINQSDNRWMQMWEKIDRYGVN